MPNKDKQLFYAKEKMVELIVGNQRLFTITCPHCNKQFQPGLGYDREAIERKAYDILYDITRELET